MYPDVVLFSCWDSGPGIAVGRNGTSCLCLFISVFFFYCREGFQFNNSRCRSLKKKQGTVRSTARVSATSLIGKTLLLSLLTLFVFLSFSPPTLFSLPFLSSFSFAGLRERERDACTSFFVRWVGNESLDGLCWRWRRIVVLLVLPVLV
ncbi:hypothetical protein J3F84DRAFT_83549 [Trichoderma pleuroticola]